MSFLIIISTMLSQVYV